MTKWAKILLAVSVLLVLASLTEAGDALGWGLLKPLGAVAFIGFLLLQLLHRETVLFDEEQRAHPAARQGVAPGRKTTTPAAR
jgi:hypothetical protein